MPLAQNFISHRTLLGTSCKALASSSASQPPASMKMSRERLRCKTHMFSYSKFPEAENTGAYHPRRSSPLIPQPPVCCVCLCVTEAEKVLPFFFGVTCQLLSMFLTRSPD